MRPPERARARRILRALRKQYPHAACSLHAGAPHELLIATILSAQATDEGVNRATPALFAAFPTPADYARAGVAKIEPFVRSINFWRMKAKAIRESMRAICERHGGEVPRTMEELCELRGVARKTANVVLGNAFGLQEGVVVDTHVLRLARRFGLSRAKDPLRVEQDLMRLFPRETWCELSHLLIAHGRASCKARGARCADDPICRRYCADARGADSRLAR